MDLLIGADVGGTTSKVVVCDVDATVRGFGSAPGGNFRSSGASSLDNIIAAIARAIADAGGGRVVGAHLGIAGAGEAGYEKIRDSCLGDAAGLGIDPAVMAVSTDLETAFAASSASGEGLLVLSGTGAVAAAFSDHQVRGRCDGMGWLLGDEGSATWIGLRALQAVARSLDHRGTPTSLRAPLLRAVADMGEGEASVRRGVAPRLAAPPLDPRQRLIADTYRLAPAAFGSLAPLVFEHADHGDPVSLDIVAEAGQALARAATGAMREAVGDAAPPCGETVLTGALLGVGGPLRARVSGLLAQSFPMLPVVAEALAAPPVVGALAMAAKAAGVPVELAALREGVAERTPFR
ncbi:MAG: hypothetical protein L0K65_01125 [Actinomyces sp.]|nr:hypothetical protein [Propionibacterium sp.]MDN6565640.1 hypothetical protein [Actinomyces sp.]